MLRCLLGWVLLASALCAMPAQAARPVVAVAPFRGPGTASVEQSVQRALKAQALVLSPARYAAVAKPLFAEGSSPEDVAAVSKELGASWTVTGVLKQENERWTLNVSLRDAATGHARSKLRYALRSPTVPPGVLRTLQQELVDALRDALSSPTPVARAQEPRERSTADEPTLRRSNVRPADGEDEEAPPGVRTSEAARTTASERARGQDAQPAQGSEGEPGNAAAPAAAPRVQPSGTRPRWARWFELSLGATLTGRRFSVDPPPPKFNSSVVAGLRADFVLYPLAFTWRSAYGLFSGIGLGVSIDKPVWPDSTSKSDMGQRFPTSELRVEGGLRWKLTLYKPMPRPQLHLIAQGGLHEFAFAKGPGGQDVVGVPDVRYVYASLGGGLTVHFAEWTWLWAQFVYHAVTDAGPIQVREQYGLAATSGLRFSAGLDFLVYKGIRIGLAGMYERFDLRFGYDPERVKFADSATDEYYGGMLTLGYVL